MIETIHRDPFFRVEREPQQRLYRLARTSAHFPDLSVAERTFAALDAALAQVPPSSLLLLDLRDGPPRPEPAFEELVGRHRDAIFSRFSRVAVLVRTAAGKLQVQRMNRGASSHVLTFDDEDRAFGYLLDGA